MKETLGMLKGPLGLCHKLKQFLFFKEKMFLVTPKDISVLLNLGC